MKKLLKKLLLLSTIAVTMHAAHGQVVVLQLSDRDSLTYLLTYIENKTTDPALKATVAQTRRLAVGNVPDDTLATSLVRIESSLLNLLEEFSILNYQPFDWTLLHSLFKKTAALLQVLPPKGENLFYATAVHYLATLYLHARPAQEHSCKADSLLKVAFSIREKSLPPAHPDYLQSLIGKAKAYLDKGNVEEALPLLQKAIHLAETGEGKASLSYADALYLLAQVYRMQHRYPESTRLFEDELAIRKGILGAESPRYSLRMYYTSFMLLLNLEYQKALRLAEQALDLTGKTLGKNDLQYAFCLEGVAAVYYRLGIYKDAVPYYEESLAIKEKLFGKEYKDISLTLHNLAKTYERMGLYQKALPLYQRATVIAEKAFLENREFDFNYGFALNQLASLYQTMRQYEPAYGLLKKAIRLTLRSIQHDSTFYATGLQNLAHLFEHTGRYDSAVVYLQRVAAIRKAWWGSEHPEYAAALYSLSCIYAKKERLDTALLLAWQVVDIREKTMGKAHVDYASAVVWLGELYLQAGDPDRAEPYLRQAMAIREGLLGSEHPDYINSLTVLAKLAIARGGVQEAAGLLTKAGNFWIHHLQRSSTALSEREKINLVAREYNQFDYLPSLLYQEASLQPHLLHQVYAHELLLKGLVLNDQQQLLNTLRRSQDSLATRLYFLWRSGRSLLAKQYFLPPQARLSSLDSLLDNTNLLEQQLARRSAQFRRLVSETAFPVKAISGKLKKGEAAIEFIRFRFFRQRWTDSVLYAAIVILPEDSTSKFIPLFEEKQLENMVQSSGEGFSWAIRKLYGELKPERSRIEWATLYNLIWQPLEPCLQGVHTIHFAPTGLLHRISFGAICNRDGKRLIDIFDLHQVFSTRSLMEEKQSPAIPSSISLWGNMAYSISPKKSMQSLKEPQRFGGERMDWPALPGTGKEINSIAALCRKAGILTEVITGVKATEERLKTLDGKGPGVLHLATHGVFNSAQAQSNNRYLDKASSLRPGMGDAMLESGLLMAGCKRTLEKNENLPSQEDGILTAYELAPMDLGKTGLVILSACNTAHGEIQGNEGIVGLQRALRLAGVRQMIVSLWKIPDKETTELMGLFYRQWLSGKSVREALRLAQLKMKEKYASPFFWAAFVLME